MKAIARWPAEHDALLVEQIKIGATFAEIARAINEKFGTAYSRNSCIGRARRKGLVSANPKSSMSPDAGRSLYNPRKRLARAQRIQFNKAPDFVGTEATVKVREAPVEPLNIDLLQLSDCTCKYPYGDDHFTFCGHEPLPGFPYCGPHVALTTKAA